MEDIKRINAWVREYDIRGYEVSNGETDVILRPDRDERHKEVAATLFISKDATPPKLFTEENLERAWKEFGMGGSDLQRDFMYVLRNLPDPNDK